MTPRVTIVAPTLNGATRGFLAESIESVLAQTFRDFELILVDDGSTDDTRALCDRYAAADSRVQCISQQNRGLGGARNAGIRAGRGEFVAFLDDDDAWLPTKLERQIAMFDDAVNADVGMAYTALELVDESGRKVGLQFHPLEDDLYARLFYENVIDAPSSVMLRRPVLETAGLFSEDLWICEDIDLWLRVARVARVQATSEPLVRYRVHSQKMSSHHERLERDQVLVMERALAVAPDRILSRADDIWYRLYEHIALKQFSLGNAREFRRYYSLAAKHKSPSPAMRVRHLLTATPVMARAAQGLWRFLAWR